MAKMTNLAIILFFGLSLISTAKAHESAVVDITKFGAVDGGCITEALSSAWKEACQSPVPSRVFIPPGNYTLGKVCLEGPCNNPIEIEVKGTIKAVNDIVDEFWIEFNKITGFKLFGGGVFDGDGAKAWEKCEASGGCKKKSMGLKFNCVNNGTIEDITSLNAKQFHMSVVGSTNLCLSRLTITAPGESPNTDGIHIGHSTNVNVTDSCIATGDDCIAFVGGTKQTTVSNVICGPGHGISVGSLGKYPKEEPLSCITVKDCRFNNTDNGVRIKTWPDLYENSASELHFENIIMNNVSNPIIIDQNYCGGKKCSQGQSKVKLSNIIFRNITGTSADPCAVKLACSSGTCEGVELSEIDLAPAVAAEQLISVCNNVRPNVVGKMNPPACTGPV
ncbi:polygalacturonase-like [Mangifera indica]|uniref:polygalacturonase-like n=1 Tax=Mangifera indica TaxID=29780 RepID=UPI001CFA8D9E|nr:polygalacturonase-like [Mangifera indica]